MAGLHFINQSVWQNFDIKNNIAEQSSKIRTGFISFLVLPSLRPILALGSLLHHSQGLCSYRSYLVMQEANNFGFVSGNKWRQFHLSGSFLVIGSTHTYTHTNECTHTHMWTRRSFTEVWWFSHVMVLPHKNTVFILLIICARSSGVFQFIWKLAV